VVLTRLTGISALSLGMVVGCSSDDPSGDGKGTGGSPGIDRLGPVTLDLDASNTGTPAGTPPAQTTPDGLQTLSSETATALTNSAMTCARWSAEAQGQPSVLEFVVDVSGSMTETSASTGRDTKWEVTREALRAAIHQLPASVAAGLSFYPNMLSQDSSTPRPVEDCVNTSDNVPIAALTAAQRTAMEDALDQVRPRVWGATPTHDAYNVALSELRAAQLPGSRYVAIITDGQPTQAENCIGTVDMCNPQPTAPIVQAIGDAWTQEGNATFVVGSPGSEANVCTGADVRFWLSQAARVGGTGTLGCTDQGPAYCHFDISGAPDFAQALSGALTSIAGSVVSCNYDVPLPPPGETLDPSKVNMIYTEGAGTPWLVLPNTSAECDRGWHYTSPANTAIEVCSITCDLIKRDPGARVDLVFGCVTGSVSVY
jgi:hypothetical protein